MAIWRSTGGEVVYSHERISLICLFTPKFMNAISSCCVPNDSLRIEHIAKSIFVCVYTHLRHKYLRWWDVVIAQGNELNRKL